MPSAQHTACTIEMTNLTKRVDVAVIDEIQVSTAAHKHHFQPFSSFTDFWPLLGV